MFKPGNDGDLTTYIPETTPDGVVFLENQQYSPSRIADFRLKLIVNNVYYELIPRPGSSNINKDVFDSDAITNWLLPKSFIEYHDPMMAHLYPEDVQITFPHTRGRYAYFLAENTTVEQRRACLLYTSPSPRDLSTSRMPSSA